MTTRINETERSELVHAVTSSDLCCPEQVCDAVLAAAEKGGLKAGYEELRRAQANDARETARIA